MLKNSSCITCGFRHNENQCQFQRGNIDPHGPACELYTRDPQPCDICGILLPNRATIIDLTDKEPIYICPSCNRLMSTCAVCEAAQDCDFETNPIDLPKTVIKQVRQGNMIMSSEIKNPDRIEKTCFLNCPCFSQENGCLREFNSQCEKFKTIDRKENV